VKNVNVNYKSQFSGVVGIEQAGHVQAAAHAAHQASEEFDDASVRLAETERSAIDITGGWRAYTMIPPLTLIADTFFGNAMLAGVFVGGLASVESLFLALFMGLTAVSLEGFAGHLYETKRSAAVRAVAFLSGLMVPAGLIWVLMTLEHALAVNTSDTAGGADIKLWIFGAMAVSLHIYLLLAGGRIRRGISQILKVHKVRRAHDDVAKALFAWKKHCEDVVLLDYRLCYSVRVHNNRNPSNPIEMPTYGAFTEHFLAYLKEQGGVPEITLATSSLVTAAKANGNAQAPWSSTNPEDSGNLKASPSILK
jgi:hypothetical protein